MAFVKSRKQFGHALGDGNVIDIGDNRYGLREEYDPKVKEKTLQYYNTGHNIIVTEVTNEKGQSIQTDRIVPHVEEIELKE